MKNRIAIVGYGNLGRGVECAIKQNSDMELYGVFTRRAPESLNTLTGAKVFHVDDILNHKDNIDTVIICGGSATDLPVQTPALAEHFNVIILKLNAMIKKSKQTASLRECLTLAVIGHRKSICRSSLLSSSAEPLVGADGGHRYLSKECLLYELKNGWYHGEFSASSC